MSFSPWEIAKANAIKTEIRRNHTMAKNKCNPDFNKQHPDWVRDAQNKNYTLLTKMVKENVEKFQKAAIARRLKVAGKD